MKRLQMDKYVGFCVLSLFFLMAPKGFAATETTTKQTTSTTTSTSTGKDVAKLSKLDPIAQVIWVKGTVKAMQPGADSRSLQRRSVIFEHDLVSTTPGSSGEIAFTDSSIVSLGSDSQVKVDQYKYKKAADDKSVLGLVKGGFRAITGAIPKENPENYQVNTPVATIGVRGTQFNALMSKTKGLLLKIEKGKILVKNANGTVELEKCATNATGVKCQLYAQVESSTSAPKTLSTQPVELSTNDPALVPVPAGFGAPGTYPPGSGPGVPGAPGSNTPGKGNPNNSFCIG